MTRRAVLVLVLALFAQPYPPSAWDGTWTWGEGGERSAYEAAFLAQAAAIAKEHCGEQYFGSICN